MSTTQVISGNRIRQARLGARLTQTQLAQEVGTSERNIVRWETNANAPRIKHIAAIARATGKDIGFFIEDEAVDEEEEADKVTRLRRIRAELVLHGRDDLADDLLRLAGAFPE